MTLAQLSRYVNLYLQTDFPAVENHPLLSQGDVDDVKVVVDELIINAANNARKWAEMRHNFGCASVEIDVTLTAALGYIDLDDLDGVSIKQLSHVLHQNSCTPYKVTSSKEAWNLAYEKDMVRHSVNENYQNFYSTYQFKEPALILAGNKLKFDGDLTEDIPLTIHGYRWLPEYSSWTINAVDTTQPPGGVPLQLTAGWTPNSVIWPTDITAIENFTNLYQSNDATQVILPKGIYPVTYLDANEIEIPSITGIDPFASLTFDIAFTTASGSNATDWFLQHGGEYMQWASIVETNHLLQTFVPRQEGGLDAPERQRDIVFEALRKLDIYASEGGSYHE